MLFFGKKDRKETCVVINIGSASAGGMFTQKSGQGDPEIITSAVYPINFLYDVDFQAHWRSTIGSLEKVISRLARELPTRPDKALCTFSPLWGLSQTRIIRVRKEKPFAVSRRLAENLIIDEAKIFASQWQKKFPYLADKSKLIEKETMKYVLNGYDVRNPFGKSARSADIYVFMTLMMRDIRKITDRVLAKAFGHIPVEFHSSGFVSFSVLKNITGGKQEFIFAKMGGETTDVSLVRGGILQETVTLPVGRNLLIRKIASGQKTFINDAISMLNSYHIGHLIETLKPKISRAIEETKEEWSEKFNNALAELSQNGVLPGDLFLLGDILTMDEMKSCFSNPRFSSFTILGKPFNVKAISSDALKHYFKFRRGFDKDNNVFLMLGALFSAAQ